MNEPKYKPLVLQRADPWVYKHTDGFYYFTASVPEYDRIEIRRAKEIEGLASAESVTIWNRHTTGPMGAHIWAPEIHFIDGRWIIYFAAGDAENKWMIRPYVLECADTDPLTGTWVEKGMIQKAEEDSFSFTEFSLDATTFEHLGRRYLIWSQAIGPGGACNLYMAEMKDPWTLAGMHTMISTPDYDWERHKFWVNEGPAVIKRNGRIFISYSASATDHRYCMGLLTAFDKADLLDPSSWSKSKMPVLASSEETGLFGPGHNSFTVSPDGSDDILIYHARNYKEIQGEPLYDPNRHTYFKKLNWNQDGTPDFGQ